MRKFYLIMAMLGILSMFSSKVAAQISAGDEAVLNTIYEELGMGEHGWSWDDDAKSVIVNGAYNLPGITVSATGFVTRIQLANKGLIGILPENFTPPEGVGALTKLKVIDLSGNTGLSGFISSSFMKFLANVEVINLSGTTITGSIPDNISDLKKLKTLNVSNTGISEIPATIGDISTLLTLNLSGNALTSIPGELFKPANLNYIDISGNSIHALPEFTTNFPNRFFLLKVENNTLDFCGIENLITGYPNAVITATPQKPSTTPTDDIEISLGGNYVIENGVCGEFNNSFQWQKQNLNKEWDDLDDQNNSSLLISNMDADQIGKYKCIVENSKAIGLSLSSSTFELSIAPDWVPNVSAEIVEDVQKTLFLQQLFTPSDIASFFLKRALNPETFDVQITSEPTRGKISNFNAATLSFTYTPNADYFGVDSAYYQATTGTESNSGVIYFNISPVNDKPTLVLKRTDDKNLETLKVTYGESVSFKAILDDSKDGILACADLTIKTITSNNYGDLAFDAATQIATFTPSTNEDLLEVLVLKAKENCASEAVVSAVAQIVRINIKKGEAPNTAPEANNVTVETKIGKAIKIHLPASDKETANSKLTVTIKSQAAHAAYLAYFGGKFNYKPESNWVGSDSFTYTVTDADGSESNVGTITVNTTQPEPITLTYNYWYMGLEFDPEGKFDDTNNWNNKAIFDPMMAEMDFAYKYFTEIYGENYWNHPDFNWTYFYLVPSIKSYSGSVFNQSESSYGLGLEIKPEVKEYLESAFQTPQDIFNALKNEIAKETEKIKIELKWNGRVVATNETNVDLNYYRYYNDGKTAWGNFANLDDQEKKDLTKSAQLNSADGITSTLDTVTVFYGESKTLDFSGTSSNGQITMNVISKPTKGNLSDFNFKSFIFGAITYYSGTYTPTENADTYDIISYTLNDGTETIIQNKVIHILPVNEAPVIANISEQAISEDNTLILDLGISDAESTMDELRVYSELTSTAFGFKDTVINGVLTVIPPSNFNGSALIEISVYDEQQAYTAANFTLTVNAENDAPQIEVDESYTVDYNNELFLVIAGTDIDEDQITLAVSGAPSWLSYEHAGKGSAILSGTPADSDAGVYTLNASVSDGATTTEKAFQIIVNGSVIDNPPVLANPILPIEMVKSNNSISVDISNVFTDADNDDIALSVSDNTNADWISTTIADGQLVITVSDPAFTGFSSITITGTSNGKESNTAISVFSLDKAPIVAGEISNVEVWKNSSDIEISLTGLITDPDEDPISYSVVSNTIEDMVNASINGETLTLKFTEGSGGNALITLAGSAYGKSAEVPFLVTVKDAAPVVSAEIEAKSLYKNDNAIAIDLTGLFTDVDDPTVEMSIESVSDVSVAAASLNGNTLDIKPGGSVDGIVEVVIAGRSNDKTTLYTITVNVLDHEPVLNKEVEAQQLFKNAEMIEIDLVNLFSDEDDSFMSLALTNNTNESLISVSLSGFSLSITPTAGMSGSSEITILGASGGKTISHSFTVTIEDRAPEVVATFNKVDAVEDDAPLKVDLSSHFSDPDGDAISYEVTDNSNSDLLTATIDGAELTIELVADAYGTGELEISATADNKTVTTTLTVDVAKKLNINAFDENNKLSVYPNPVKENLSVLWTGQNNLSEVQLNVIDLTGRILVSKDLQQLKPNEAISIPMNHVSQGIYIVQILSDEIRFNTQISK